MSPAGVPEQDKLSIALSYIDAGALDWYVQALNRQTRSRTWEKLKAKLKRHYLATTDEEALEELKRARQDSTVLLSLRRFNRAASACNALSEKLKTKLSVRGLTPDIQNWVYPQKPPNMDTAITEGFRAESELTRQSRLRYRPDRAEPTAAPAVRGHKRVAEATATYPLRDPRTWTPRAPFRAAPARRNFPRTADPRTGAKRVRYIQRPRVSRAGGGDTSGPSVRRRRETDGSHELGAKHGSHSRPIKTRGLSPTRAPHTRARRVPGPNERFGG